MECSEMFAFFDSCPTVPESQLTFTGIGNTPSIKFYESIGAENMGKEWQVMRLAENTLVAMAKRGPEVERR